MNNKLRFLFWAALICGSCVLIGCSARNNAVPLAPLLLNTDTPTQVFTPTISATMTRTAVLTETYTSSSTETPAASATLTPSPTFTGTVVESCRESFGNIPVPWPTADFNHGLYGETGNSEGQKFTASSSYTMTRIDLRVRANENNPSPTGEMWLDIQGTSGEFSDGVTLPGGVSSPIDLSTLTTTVQTYSFYFSPGCQVTAGSSYSIMVRDNCPIKPYGDLNFGQSDHPGGTYFFFETYTSTWYSETPRDLWTRIYGY